MSTESGLEASYRDMILDKDYPSRSDRSKIGCMGLDDYKVVLYRNDPDGWVAEIPAIEGCYALMSTREQALSELGQVFEMIAAEYREKGASLPVDTTEIVHA